MTTQLKQQVVLFTKNHNHNNNDDKFFLERILLPRMVYHNFMLDIYMILKNFMTEHLNPKNCKKSLVS